MAALRSFLGYDFNSVEITNEVYSPRAHGTINSEQDAIRSGFAQVLSGERSIPIEVKGWLNSDGSDPEILELRRLLLRWLRLQVNE